MKSTIVSLGLAVAVTLGMVACMDADAGPKSKTKAATGQQMDTKSGPAWQTLQGKLAKVEGDIYLVEDYEGTVHRVHVGKDTKRLNGAKKPGDSIRAEITRGYHANSIQ